MFLDMEQQDKVWSTDDDAHLSTALLRELNIISNLGRVVEVEN